MHFFNREVNMMTNPIYGMTNYYNLFTSPLKSYQDNPTNNLIFSAAANNIYMKTFAQKTTSEMSSYLSALNSTISDLKSASKSLANDGQASGFNQKRVTASDNNAVTGTAVSNADAATYTFNISKLAKAQNAEYTIDGKQYTSQQNTISINSDKVSVTLNKADSKDIKVKVGSDSNAIKSDIKDFINSFNSTINLTNSYSSSFSGAANLNSELSSIASSRMSFLDNIGIKQNSDGTLNLDEKKLDTALSENLSQVKDTFNGFNGVAEKTYNKSNEVLSSLVKYSKPTETSKPSYNNYGNQSVQGAFPSFQNNYRGMIVDTLL